MTPSTLSQVCEFIKAGYPFRLVYLKRNGPNDYHLRMTPAGIIDGSWAERSWLPIVNDSSFGNRRDTFIGVINAEETFQPHEFDDDEIIAVEICEKDGKLFMVKGNCLRMPLKAIFPTVGCNCNCGARYSPNFNIGITASGAESGAPSRFKLDGMRPTYTVSSTIAKNFIKYTPITTLHIIVEEWTFSSSLTIAIFTPQDTGDCAFIVPPVFNHPYCPGYEMKEYFLVSRTARFQSYRKQVTPGPPDDPIQEDSIGTPQVLSKVGFACYSGSPGIFPIISDMNKSSWSAGADLIAPAQPTGADFTDLSPNSPNKPFTQDDITFPSWEINKSFSLSDPVTSNFPPCEDCICHEPPPSWHNPC